jgi:hypothetical protein
MIWNTHRKHPTAQESPALTRRVGSRHRVGGIALGGLVILHGGTHLFGAAKGLGWAAVPALAQPISVGSGVGWLAAALVTMATGVLFLASVRYWWLLGGVAVLLSQAVIALDWSDAAYGTVVNILLAVAVTYGYAAHGPNSFESKFRRGVDSALESTSFQDLAASATGPDGLVLTERDLDGLPAPVARYVRQSGAVGKPRVSSFQAQIHGRIRAGADQPWMVFTGEQVNTYGTRPARLFKMDATKGHLPVDVLHVFAEDAAAMRVKLCSLLPLVNASGPELTRAETVTVLNDLCVLAPAALVTMPLNWLPMDEHRVQVTFTQGEHTVTAVLLFDEQDRLVDFISDDRCAASADGKTFRRQRWSTPLCNYRDFHGRTISASGLGCWHAPEPVGRFAYLEFEVDDIIYLGDDSRSPSTATPASERVS